MIKTLFDQEKMDSDEGIAGLKISLLCSIGTGKHICRALATLPLY